MKHFLAIVGVRNPSPKPFVKPKNGPLLASRQKPIQRPVSTNKCQGLGNSAV